MEKINVAEILKDCPSGMELDCTMFENTFLERVEKNIEYPIVIRIGKTDIIRLTKDGCWNKYSNAKCIIFPKGKTTWEGFQRPFKDGDIIVTDDGDCSYIALYKGMRVSKQYKKYNYHAGIFSYGDIFTKNDWAYYSNPRLATEEEKQKLFQAIKDNGYKWNAETKTIEKLPKFKDGDIVATQNGIWIGIHKRMVGNAHEVYFAINHDCLIYNDNIFCFERLATEEEKQRLFDAIKAYGYKWNAETKTLEKLVEPKFKVGDIIKDKCNLKWKVTNENGHYYEVTLVLTDTSKLIEIKAQDDYELVPNKFGITTLKPFDKVLVRMCDTDIWECDIFSTYSDNYNCKFHCIGSYYNQCIPYEANKELLGTTKDCDEYYKNW